MVAIVAFLIGFVTMVAFILRFTLKPKKDIIDTSVIEVLRISSIGILLTWLGLTLTYLIITVQQAESAASYLGISVWLFTLAPFVMSAYSYLKFDTLTQRKYEGKPLLKSKDWGQLQQLVGQISAEFQIQRPQVRCSEKSAVPIIYGRDSSTSVLVLPDSLPDIIRSVVAANPCEEDEEAAVTTLSHYVIAHELSHVKHGDVGIRCIVRIWLGYAGYFTVAALLAGLALMQLEPQVTSSTSHVSFSCIAPSMFAVVCGLLWVCHRLATYHAERLADARAILLTQEMSGMSTDHTDSLLIQMAIMQQLTGATNSHRSFSFLTKLLPSHPPSRARQKAIQQRSYIAETQLTVGNGPAILIGAWGALTLASGLWTANFLAADLHLYTVADIAKEVVVMIPSFYTLIFVLPLRNSITQPQQHFAGLAVRLSANCVVSCLSFLCMYSLLVVLRMGYWYLVGVADLTSLLRRLPGMGLVAVSYYALAFLLTLTFSALIVDSEKSVHWQDALMIGSAVLTVVYAIMPFVLVSWDRIQFISLLVSILTGSTLLSAGLDTELFSNKNMCIWRVRGRAVTDIDCLASNLPHQIVHVVNGLLLGLFLLIIPMLIVYLPVRWLVGRALALDTGIAPIALLILLCPSMLALSYDTFNRGFIALYHKVLVQKDLFGSMSPADTDMVLEQSAKLKTIGSGYRRQGNRFPHFAGLVCMEATCSALQSLWYLSGNLDQEALDWVLKQEHETGGFSTVEDVSTELDATYQAVVTLDEVRQMGRLRYRQNHVHFICQHQMESGGFRPSGMKRPTLEATYQAIRSLAILGYTNDAIRNPTGCADWAWSEWEKGENKGRLNFEETHYLVYCLKWLAAFDEERRHRILNQWLPTHRAAMLNLRPDTNYEKVYHYIKLLDLLGMRAEDRALASIMETLKRKASRISCR